jgi:hypothetical protein
MMNEHAVVFPSDLNICMAVPPNTCICAPGNVWRVQFDSSATAFVKFISPNC